MNNTSNSFGPSESPRPLFTSPSYHQDFISQERLFDAHWRHAGATLGPPGPHNGRRFGAHTHHNGAPLGPCGPFVASKRRYPVGNCSDPHGPHGGFSPKRLNRHQLCLLRAKLLYSSNLAQPHGDSKNTPLEEFFVYIQTYISNTGIQFDMCLSLVSLLSSLYALVYSSKTGGGFFSKTAAIAGCCSSLFSIINASIREARRERSVRAIARAIVTPVIGTFTNLEHPESNIQDVKTFLDEMFNKDPDLPPSTVIANDETIDSDVCTFETAEEYLVAAKAIWSYCYSSNTDQMDRFITALDWFAANPVHPDIDAVAEVPFSGEPKHQLGGTTALTRLRKTIAYAGDDCFPHASFDYRALGPLILNLCTVISLIGMRFFSVNISDFARLIRDKNTLQKEFGGMVELVDEMLYLGFGVSASADTAFVNQLTTLIDESKAFATLTPAHYYDRKNFSACSSWLLKTEDFITNARRSVKLMQSPGIQILQNAYATIKIGFDECKRSRENAGVRIEPVVIQLNGLKGVGKSHFAYQLVRWIASRTDLSPDIYHVNMSGSSYYPAYGNQSFVVIDEFLANDNDVLRYHFNTMASSTPFKMEGASVPEKNQWCNASFIIVITNEVRKTLKGLSPLVEEALYSRLNTIEIQFADQKLDDPRSPDGRQPDYSHLRLVYRNFIRNGGHQEGSGPFVEVSSHPVSCEQVVSDVTRRYQQNLDNFRARVEASERNIAPPTTIGPELKVPVVKGIGNQFCEAHGAVLPFTVVCSGTAGSGKTYFAREYLSRSIASYFHLPVVPVSDLTMAYSEPAIYLIDDLLCDETLSQYMTFTNTCPHGSIIWVCTNIDVKWANEIKSPGIGWLYGLRDPYYSVDIKCGSFSGVLRRLSLCGNIHSRDSKGACFVTHIERNGVHFKFERHGTKAEFREFGPSPGPLLTFDDMTARIREAKMDYDKMSGGITYVFDDVNERALLDADCNWDLQFNFPSLSTASSVLTNCNSLLVHWTSGSTIRIGDGVLDKIGHGGREAATWVAPFPATTPDHFRQLAEHYTRKLWQVSRNLSAKFIAGPYACTFRNGVANIIGAKGVAVEGHSTNGANLIVAFKDDHHHIEAPVGDFYMLTNGPAPQRFSYYSVPKVCAAKAYLQGLTGDPQDPLYDMRMKSLRDNRMGMWTAFKTGMQVSLVKLITKYPLFTTLAALFAASVGLVFMWYKFFGSPSETERDRRRALEYLADMQGRMNHDDTPSVSEFIRADKEFDYLMKEHSSDYRAAITRYSGVYSMCRRSHPHAGRKKVVNSYGDEKNTRHENAKSKSRKDLEQIFTNSNMVTPEFASLCRDSNMHYTRDAFARYVEDPTTFDWTKDERDRFTLPSEPHLISGIPDNNPTQLNSWANRISKSTCMVSTDSLSGLPLRVHGLCIGQNRILTVAHIVRDYDATLVVTITKLDPAGVPHQHAYPARAVFINRELELALVEVQDPSWQPAANIRHLFAPGSTKPPIYGHSVKPSIGGSIGDPRTTIVSSHYLKSVNDPKGGETLEFKSLFDCIPIRVNGPSYVSTFSDTKAHTLGKGDCGTVLLATGNHANGGPIFGMYIGRCGISPYWVRCDAASLSSMEIMARERELSLSRNVQAHGLMFSNEVNAGSVTFIADYPHANIVHPTKSKPLCDLTSKGCDDGGVIGYLSRDATKERVSEKPCRTPTLMDPDFLPSSKVPAPVHINQVEHPDALEPIPSGVYGGLRSLVAGQCLQHFNNKRSVDERYYARAIDELYYRLPTKCLDFGVKPLDVVLNGGDEYDPYRDQRSAPNLNSHPGYIYEVLFSMTNKHRFFRCEKVGGSMVASHPLVLDDRPNGPGAYLLERYNAIWAAALEGKTLLCVGKNFIKRELIAKNKATTGVVRTVEAGDFALTLFMDSVLADFYERRRNSDGDHMVIGRDLRTEGAQILRHLFEKDNERCVALDVSKWDRSTSQETIAGAARLAFMAARKSDNYKFLPAQIDNLEKAVIAYTTVPVSILHDCVYWTRGRMPSGCRFTAEFNTDGHAIMRRAGFYHHLEKHDITKRPLPSRDLYSECVAEVIYGDDVLFSMANKEWLTPYVFTSIYRNVGYTVTNDRKDGDPCFTTYEDASFCSRFVLRQNGRVDMALKKESISSLIHWTSMQDASHIATTVQSAVLESIPWGRPFYESVVKKVRIMMSAYGVDLYLPSYGDAEHFLCAERPQDLSFPSICYTHGGSVSTIGAIGCSPDVSTACVYFEELARTSGWSHPTYVNHIYQNCCPDRDECHTAWVSCYQGTDDNTYDDDDEILMASQGCHPTASLAREAAAVAAIRHLGQNWPVFEAHGGSDIISASDPICVLNELCMRFGWDMPTYNLVARAGPAHSPTFAYSVVLKGKMYSPPSIRFKTKKGAMKSAAYACITECLDIEPSWRMTYSTMFSEYAGGAVDVNLRPNGYRCTTCYSPIAGATDVFAHVRKCPSKVWFRVIKGNTEDFSAISDPPRIIDVEECTTTCEAHAGGDMMNAANTNPAAMQQSTSVAPAMAAAPEENNLQPGSGTIPSEGPEIIVNFLGPAGAQPLELLNMVGPMYDHYTIARDVWIDTQTPTRKITSENKRGTIIQVFSYLDSSNWSTYMVEQAQMNEICGGGVSFQIETHGPATNGGCLRAVWLPYTPTTQSINIPTISQYPYVELPMGGDHNVNIALLDSKLTPQVRRVAEFFDTEFDKTTTCSIVMYVDQELNNGFNVGSTEENKLFMQYVIRAKFGPYWVMGRGKTGTGADTDPLVGKTLAELTGNPGNRLTIGELAEFAPVLSEPCRSLRTMMRSITTVSLDTQQSKVAANYSAFNTNPADPFDAYLCKIDGDRMGLNILFSYTDDGRKFNGYLSTPVNQFVNNDNYRASGNVGWAETIYVNTQLPFTYTVYFSYEKGVLCRVRTIRVMGTTNGEELLLVTLETQINYSQLPTARTVITVDGSGLIIAISAFLSSNFTYFQQPSDMRYGLGVLGYKPVSFTEDVYPGSGDYFRTRRDRNFINYVRKFVRPRTVITLASPTRPNYRVPVIFDGTYLACNGESYAASLTDIDEYVIVATSTFGMLASVESVSTPVKPYNIEGRTLTSRYFEPRSHDPEPIIDIFHITHKAWANRKPLGRDYEYDKKVPLLKNTFNADRAIARFVNLHNLYMEDRRRGSAWNASEVFKKMNELMTTYNSFQKTVAHGAGEVEEDHATYENGDCEAHAAIAEVFGLALSGAGQAVADVVKSKREQQYALQRMHTSFENSIQLANNDARLKQQLMYAQRGLTAYDVSKGLNGHTMDYDSFSTNGVRGGFSPQRMPTISTSTRVRNGRRVMPLDARMEAERTGRRFTDRHNYRTEPVADTRRVTDHNNYAPDPQEQVQPRASGSQGADSEA